MPYVITTRRAPGLPSQYADMTADALAAIVRLVLPADHAAHVALRELELRARQLEQ